MFEEFATTRRTKVCRCPLDVVYGAHDSCSDNSYPATLCLNFFILSAYKESCRIIIMTIRLQLSGAVGRPCKPGHEAPFPWRAI